jgi:hypothetical protein
MPMIALLAAIGAREAWCSAVGAKLTARLQAVMRDRS